MREGFTPLVTAARAWALGRLAPHHRDPFDRLLIAQALIEGVPVITADARFADYGVARHW